MGTDVLILTAPFGAGHSMTAQAVAQGLQVARPGFGVRVVDVAEHSRTLRLTAKSYLALLKWTPSLYRTLYSAAAKDHARTTALVVSRLLMPVRRLLLKYQPRLVVCTHPFVAAAVARLRVIGECPVPVCSVVTDFVAHPLWVQPGIDRYFVAADVTARSLRAAGAASIQIAVTGIPIRPGFLPALESSKGHVLVLGGSLGLGPIKETTQLLAAAGLQVTVVCGTNARLQATLAAERLAHVDVLGYTPDIAALMRGAAVVVTKPGGLSCSEALAVGVPLVLTGALPGHEEENAAVLMAAGVAKLAQTPIGTVAQVRALLLQESSYVGLRRACLQLGRPEAAATVAAQLLQMVELAYAA